jgi:amidase
MGGRCNNPFDADRSCGTSSSGTGAAIAAGLGLVGLGTDTSGSIAFPSSYCGLFGLRSPYNYTNLAGIISVVDEQDTVGPVAKHLDDLVLAHSVMIDDSSIYDSYSRWEGSSPSNLKLRVIRDFIEGFELSFVFGNFSYEPETQVRQAVDSSLNNFKEIGVSLFENRLNQSELSNIKEIIQGIYVYNGDCNSSCMKKFLNIYFNDSSRFDADAPYHNFEELLRSPLLDDYWKKTFTKANSSNSEEMCQSACAIFRRVRKQSQQLVESWFGDDQVDAIAFPTSAVLPTYHNYTKYGNPFYSVVLIFTLAAYPTLNLPISYVEKSDTLPDGIPIGLLLVTKPEKLLNTLRIAKLFENTNDMVKLPHTTPLIVDENEIIPEIPQKCDLNQAGHLFSHSILVAAVIFIELFINW